MTDVSVVSVLLEAVYDAADDETLIEVVQWAAGRPVTQVVRSPVHVVLAVGSEPVLMLWATGFATT